MNLRDIFSTTFIPSQPAARMDLVKREGESYKHAAARTVVADWLNEVEVMDGVEVLFEHQSPYGGFRVTNQYWRPNRGALIEVPVTYDDVRDGYAYAWDERMDGVKHRHVPTYDQCVSAGYDVAMVFDIAVYHKGCISFAVEICHRHPVSFWKEDVIREFSVPVYEMDAEWVLQQQERPLRLRAGRAWNV